MHSHHPIHCIVPPHMLTEISQRGTQRQKDAAMQSLVHGEQVRATRFANAARAAFAGGIAGVKQRRVHDAQNGSSLPGALARAEGQPPVMDDSINEAYDSAGLTYDLFQQVYGRNSIDGNGLPIVSTVHFQKGYDNAFWNGSQMVYGDGDEDLPLNERLFNRFTACLDVIGHELTHGVTQYEANLTYVAQSGALNESMSDVFGSLVKQFQRGQTAAEADWIIGEGLFTANVSGAGIRSMKAPGTAYDDAVLGKDPQPAHMRDYLNTSQDNGGVHINSGIPNHAFYTACVTLGGNAWEKMGLVWYKTLSEKLNASANFQNAADLTYQSAGELFGVGSAEQTAVKVGWTKVGVYITGVVTEPPTDNEGCLAGLLRLLGVK